jgi:peptidyl-prolyl cis-trans isomerase B (cyclophilin B)
MPNRRTRDRQLRKLHERRIAERKRKQRQRTLTLVISSVLVVGLAVGLVLVLAGRGGKSAASPTHRPTPSASATTTPQAVACDGTKPPAASVKKKSYPKPPPMTIDLSKTYTATLRTSCGTIAFQLDPRQSPKTVNSLVFLARQKFYDGLTFHRLSKDFVIQGGDPTGSGSGGPGYSTVDAPPNDAKYPVGTVAMAKAGNEPAGTAGSQFFIVTGSGGSSLTPDYAIVGQVTSGQDVAKKIENLPIQQGADDGPPAQTVYILSFRIKES